MRHRTAVIALVLASAALIAIQGARVTAQNADLPAAIELGPGSVLWLEGKSNLHGFESKSSKVTVKFTRDPGTKAPSTAAELEALLRASGVRNLSVDVPVKSLHSDKEALDKNLWKDLRSDDYPAIQFHLNRYTLTSKESRGDTMDIRAEGSLTVAGREQPVTLAGRAYRSDHGVWLDGTQPLRMTEFGIKPRTMMLGTLRVKDEVAVHYRLLLVPGDSK